MTRKAFIRKSVEELSWQKGEPSWMTETRLAAWDTLGHKSLSRLLDMDLTTIDAYTEPPRHAVPSHEWPRDLQHALDERGDEEGLIIQRDSVILSRAITKDATKRGVLYTDLDTAVKAAPELLKRYFGKQVKAEDPWAAIHQAFWSGGTFLYVPAHVKIQLPFHTCYWLSRPSAAIFPHTLIVVEKGGRISFTDEFLSIRWPQPALSVSVAELVVRENAHVDYCLRPNWGASVYHERRQQSHVAGSAQLRCSEVTGHREAMTLERVAELYPEVRP